MSPDLERLIGRAVIDQAFRDHLLHDPDAAIAASGLTLTPDEIAKVKAAAKARGANRAATNQALDTARAGAWN
jgi:hypothetical protein